MYIINIKDEDDTNSVYSTKSAASSLNSLSTIGTDTAVSSVKYFDPHNNNKQRNLNNNKNHSHNLPQIKANETSDTTQKKLSHKIFFFK